MGPCCRRQVVGQFLVVSGLFGSITGNSHPPWGIVPASGSPTTMFRPPIQWSFFAPVGDLGVVVVVLEFGLHFYLE